MNQQWSKATNERPGNASNSERIQRQIENDGNGATGFSNYAQAYRIRNPISGPGLYTGYGTSHLRSPGHGEGSSSSSRSSMPRMMSQEDVFWPNEVSTYIHQFEDAALVPAATFSKQTHHDIGGGLGVGGTSTYVSQMNTSDYRIASSSGAMVGGDRVGGASLMVGAQIPIYPLTAAAQESPSDKSVSISAGVDPLTQAKKPTSDREPAHPIIVEHTPSKEIKLSKEREVEVMLDWLEMGDNLEITQGRQKTKVGNTESITHAYRRAATYFLEKTGVIFTGTALYGRWQRHKALYKKVSKMAQGTGAGVGEDDGVSTFDELLESKCPGYGRMDAIFRNTPQITPLGHVATRNDGLNVSRLGRTTISLARSGLGGHSYGEDEEEQNNSGTEVFPVDREYDLLDEFQESDQESDRDDNGQEQPGRIVNEKAKDKSMAASSYRSPKPVLSASTSSSISKRRRSFDRSSPHRGGTSSARSERNDGPTDFYDAPEKAAPAKGGMNQLMEIKYQKELELQRLAWQREDIKERERKKEEEAKRAHDREMLRGKLLLKLLDNGTSPKDPYVARLLGGMDSIKAPRSSCFFQEPLASLQEPLAALRPSFSQTPPPDHRQASFQTTPVLHRQKSSQGSSSIGHQTSSQVPLAIRRGTSPQGASVPRRLSSTEMPHNPLSRQAASNGTPRNASVHALLLSSDGEVSFDDEILPNSNELFIAADDSADDSADDRGDVSYEETTHNIDI